MKPEQWIVSRDTGVSSETMWCVFMDVKPRWKGVPLDVDDFGRCVRLLTVVPEFRPRLQEVAVIYPEWKQLIDNWEELEHLYQEWETDNRSSETWQVFYDKITPLIKS